MSAATESRRTSSVTCCTCWKRFLERDYAEPAKALREHYLAIHGGLA